MKNTSILKRIMGLALSLALLVSMMPMLASEVYAAGETVHIYKEDGSEAESGVDYTIDEGVRYNLKTDNLKVTTKGYVAKASFALADGIRNVTFENCRVFVDEGFMIQGDEKIYDQTINISGDCDFMCNNNNEAMHFDCDGGHEVTFTSSDENNSLDIENYGGAISVVEGSLNFTGKVNATITGDVDHCFITVQENFYITDDAKVKVSCVDTTNDNNDGIVTEGNLIMDGNSKLEATARGTAVTAGSGHVKKLIVRENASLIASSYHYVVAKTFGEAVFDTTGRVELTNYNSDGLLCEKLKVLNRDGTVLIRGTESTAIKLINEGDITLGNKVKMYASTDLNEPEQSINKEFVDVKWKKEGSAPADYYHPYFVIDGADKEIKAVLIKGVSETPVGPGGGGNTDASEIDKLKDGLASAEAQIEELDEHLQELIKTVMNTKTKVKKLKSKAKRSAKVEFNKIPGATVYEIQYKQSGKKWKAVKTKKLTKTFKKLKSGKRFYAKVRGIYEKGTIKVYGKWSTTKSVKVK